MCSSVAPVPIKGLQLKAPLAQDAGKPGVDSVAFATSQKMLAGDVVKRGRRGQPCAGHAEPVGQLPGEPWIKRLIAFAEGHGVFADYRDDFSLLDKIKQVFPEIVGPNRAHSLFVARLPVRGAGSVAS